MIACLDVQYGDDHATAACILFENWRDAQTIRQFTVPVYPIAPYIPVEFYRRELPCLLAALQQVTERLEAVLIDGYVWLSTEGAPGLGARLFDSLQGQTPVVGIAKTKFATASSIEILRGRGRRPLYITAAGIDPTIAAGKVQLMHGSDRIPTIVRLTDRLARSTELAK